MMATQKRIGKIQRIEFGFGGYDDAMIGISVTLGSDKEGWGVGEFKGTWANRPDGAGWTLESQARILGETVIWFKDLLIAAKRKRIEDLEGTPVEVTFENDRLKSWRVLTEVI